MKKMILLSSIFAVGMAFADKTVDSTEVGVMRLTAYPKANLLAIPFLGYTNAEITVADMVNTAELAEHSKLYVPNSSGTYDVWELGSDKKWKTPVTNITIDGDGASESAGAAANAVQTGRGGAFWLEPANESETPVYLLGKPAADTDKGKSTAVGGTWNLVGNASYEELTTLGAAVTMRDQVAIQIEGKLCYYYYMYKVDDNGWYYQDEETGVWLKNQTFPVALGQGFWFKPAETVTINWANGEITKD